MSAGPGGGAGGPTCNDVQGLTGCCSGDGAALYYCDATGVQSQGCPKNDCGWDDVNSFFNCGHQGASDPNGIFSLTCPFSAAAGGGAGAAGGSGAGGTGASGAGGASAGSGGASGAGGATGGSGGSGGCTTAVVINEVSTDGASASDEYVEFFNSGTCPVDLSGWTIKYSSASGSSPGTIWTGSSGQKLPAGGYFVVAGSYFFANSNLPAAQIDLFNGGGLPLTGGAVGLFDPSMQRQDAMAWQAADSGNPLVEKTPTANIPSGMSASRIPDGTDTDDNSKDFTVPSTRTPAAANKP